MEITKEKLIEIYSKNGWDYKLNPYYLNIFAIRGYNKGGFHSNTFEIFDDIIGVFFSDSNENGNLIMWAGTTDPSVFYLNNPINTNGTAIIVPGFYKNSHCVGMHQGKYKALVQRLGPVKVYRKKSLNDNNYINIVYTGEFGINLHYSIDDAISTNKASAGCLVFQDVQDFDVFIATCEKHKSLYGNVFSLAVLDKNNCNLNKTRSLKKNAVIEGVYDHETGVYYIQYEGKKDAQESKTL